MYGTPGCLVFTDADIQTSRRDQGQAMEPGGEGHDRGAGARGCRCPGSRAKGMAIARKEITVDQVMVKV